MDSRPSADTERWGKPPRRKARPGTKWLGKWERTTVSTYTTGGGDWDRDRLAWMREYLELDGHEDCCHHTWPVFVLVEPAQYDGCLCEPKPIEGQPHSPACRFQRGTQYDGSMCADPSGIDGSGSGS